jgi:predicted transglutaminase-like protease
MYWDIWNTKLIKTDDKGHQIGNTFGYGCQCEDTNTRVGIFYDAKNRTVSFYKNGLCQGVAFTNVMSGLYPSLDVWFQAGEIEIMSDKSP